METFGAPWILISSGNEELKEHLANAPKNAVYTSPPFQNEIVSIDSIIADYIQEKIINQIQQEDGLFAIFADETQDAAKMEQLSICSSICLKKTLKSISIC